jgi:hypothetical protein
MDEKLHKHLIDVAKAGQVTYYSEIAPMLGLDMSHAPDRDRISQILDGISSHEHQQGHPLLSVVVIHRQDNMPGHGFFTLAERLHVKKEKDNFLFYIQELRSVHDFWKQHMAL